MRTGCFIFFFNDPATTEIYTLSLHDSLPIYIFNERNIDDLIIVNAKREPIGLVDSQDLPKLKAV